MLLSSQTSLSFTVHGFSTVVPKMTTTSQTDDSATDTVPGKMKNLNESFIIILYGTEVSGIVAGVASAASIITLISCAGCIFSLVR